MIWNPYYPGSSTLRLPSVASMRAIYRVSKMKSSDRKLLPLHRSAMYLDRSAYLSKLKSRVQIVLPLSVLWWAVVPALVYLSRGIAVAGDTTFTFLWAFVLFVSFALPFVTILGMWEDAATAIWKSSPAQRRNLAYAKSTRLLPLKGGMHYINLGEDSDELKLLAVKVFEKFDRVLSENSKELPKSFTKSYRTLVQFADKHGKGVSTDSSSKVHDLMVDILESYEEPEVKPMAVPVSKDLDGLKD